jgi:hypothetical protein
MILYSKPQKATFPMQKSQDQPHKRDNQNSEKSKKEENSTPSAGNSS